MRFKKIVAFALSATFILQAPVVLAVENTVASPVYVSSENVNTTNIDNNEKSQSKIGEAIKSSENLNFSIQMDNNILIDFDLDNIKAVAEKKLSELNSITEHTYKLDALKNLYDEILLLCNFYGSENLIDYDTFRWAIFYNLAKYILIDYENLENLPKNDIAIEEIQVIANTILNIKTKADENGNILEVSNDRFIVTLDRFYLNLRKSIELQDVVFIKFTQIEPEQFDEKEQIDEETSNDEDVLEDEVEIILPEEDIESQETTSDGYATEIAVVKPIDPHVVENQEQVKVDYAQDWNIVNAAEGTSLIDETASLYVEDDTYLTGNNIELTVNNEDKMNLTYVDYKNGVISPLGIKVKADVVDFENEKRIVKNLSKKLETDNLDNISNYITDSNKLMVSTNGKLLISEFTKMGKTQDNISEFYKPIDVDIIFKEETDLTLKETSS